MNDGFKRARYSEVERRLWNDARFRSLSPIPPCGQGLWLYLLTTPSLGSLPGLIVMGESAMAEHLGWSLKAFREVFQEAFGKGFGKGMAEADWQARLVVTFKAIGRQTPQSPNVIVSWRQQWLEVPDCALKTKYYQHLKAFVEGLPEGFQKAFAKACPDPSPNQEQEQEQDQEQDQDGEGEGRGEVGSAVRLRLAPPTSKRPTRLPIGWSPQAHEPLQTLTKKRGITEAEVDHQLERFRDHWAAASGKNAVKLDWDAAFRTWLNRSVDDGRIGGHFPPPPKPRPEQQALAPYREVLGKQAQ